MQHVTSPKELPTTATIATTSLALERSNSKNVANIKIILFDSFERLARGIKFRTSLLYNNGFSAYLCSLILGFRLASRRKLGKRETFFSKFYLLNRRRQMQVLKDSEHFLFGIYFVSILTTIQVILLLFRSATIQFSNFYFISNQESCKNLNK